MQQNFSQDKLIKLYSQCKLTKKNNRCIVKLSTEIKQYVDKYFFHSINDNYYFLNVELKTFRVFDRQKIINVFYNFFPKELNDYMLKLNSKIFTETINPKSNEQIYDDNINLFKGYVNERKPFIGHTEEAKNGVKTFLQFMRDVLVSNEEQMTYLLKWLSNMFQGNKNDTVLYLKGIQGIGKSTFTEFISKYVLGPKICIKSNTDPLLTSYNKILMGKLLVVFEELPCFTASQWQGVSSRLKDTITSNEMIYSDKYEKSFSALNINNYIINTNVDSIKGADGRRYFCLDLSTKYLEDHTFFGNLQNSCMNKDCGSAFFNYIIEHYDIKDFNSQKDMPETTAKQEYKTEYLHPVFVFIKEKYVKTNTPINTKLKKFYEEYCEYCKDEEQKNISIINLNKKLKEAGIFTHKSHGSCCLKVSIVALKEISEKFDWKCPEIDTDTDYDSDTEKDNENDLIREIELLKIENEALKISLKRPFNINNFYAKSIWNINKKEFDDADTDDYVSPSEFSDYYSYKSHDDYLNHQKKSKK